MTILLDECLPKRLARLLPGYEVKTSRQMNWQGLTNGQLLAAADPHFDVFLTVDKNLVHQQNLGGFRLAVIVLRAPSNKIEDLVPLMPKVLALLPTLKPGQVVKVTA
ncbi:MAG: DUF5615 family PIN-like protein [Verrucomicrobiota bacterium]|jgi:predicted nuclease of predicted toxin-antitoxin system